VAVSGRTCVTLAQAEMADEALPFLSEFQVHAFGVILAAGEAEVFLLRMRFCGVAAGGAFGHEGDCTGHFLESRGSRLSSELRRRSCRRQWQRRRTAGSSGPAGPSE
jgi:hypothetical protein